MPWIIGGGTSRSEGGCGRRKANIYSSLSDRRAYGTISAMHGSNLMMQNNTRYPSSAHHPGMGGVSVFRSDST